jgi:hypothetical protein
MAAISVSAIAVGIGIIWVEPDRHGKIADRFVVVATTGVRKATTVVRGDIIWLEPDRLIVVANRFVEISLVTNDVCATYVRTGKIGVEPNSLAVNSATLIVSDHFPSI